jgi:hypothetical protein
MKFFIFLFFPLLVFASDNFAISPTGKMQLRYENKSHTYSSLGEQLYKKKKNSYDDYVLAGSLGVQTQWETYKFNASLYTALRLHNKNKNSLKNENAFYDKQLNSFAFLGELNVQNTINNHTFTLGRQAYNSSLVNSNDRITKNSYEAVRYDYENKYLQFSTLLFHKIASSTLANNVPYNHKYGFLGYGLGYDSTHFTSVSKHIINKELSSNEALHFIVKYGNNKSFMEYENLFVNDFFNTSKLTLAHHIDKIYFKIGMISQFSVGKKYVEAHIENTQQNKKLRSTLYQAQLKYQNDDFALAYTIAHTPYDANHIYKGTLFTPFSNKPTWIYGVNTSHAMIANTTSQKISAVTHLNIAKLPTTLAGGYVYYDIGKHNGLSNTEQKTQEWYVHLQQHFSKHLSATLQYSNTKNYDPLTHDTHNTRLIFAYTF